jgi:hypothetical protein
VAGSGKLMIVMTLFFGGFIWMDFFRHFLWKYLEGVGKFSGKFVN